MEHSLFPTLIGFLTLPPYFSSFASRSLAGSCIPCSDLFDTQPIHSFLRSVNHIRLLSSTITRTSLTKTTTFHHHHETRNPNP